MVAILDHAAALIIGTIVLVTVMVFRNDSAEIAVERTMHYATKKHTLALGDILERDIVNIGFDAVPGDQVISRHSTRAFGGDSFTDTLEFRGMSVDKDPVGVRYVVSIVDSATIDEQTVPVLSWARYENDGAGWTPAGAAEPSLVDFDVDLLNESNTPTDVDGARKLRIRFKNALLTRSGGEAEVDTRELLSTFYWGITVEPAGLKRQTYQG